MQRQELVEMLENIDGLWRFVSDQVEILPTDTGQKVEAAEVIQSLKYGIVKLIEAHDLKMAALKRGIEERRAHHEAV